MTIRALFLCFAVSLVGLVFANGIAKAQTDDPTTYFGGIETEPYVQWLEETTPYERTKFLPSPAGDSTGTALHWTIRDDQIFLAVAAKATGW